MPESAYPLRCQPHFKSYLWGGRQLSTRLSKSLPDDGVWAESWEIIDHPQHQSLIVSGPKAGQNLGEITRRSAHWLLGPGIVKLPLLLKYLDCQNVLSIQVHPNDQYALRMVPSDLGKTEAWYIVDCQPGAALYAGLKSGVTRSDLLAAIHSGQVDQCLHQICPQAGDCVFIPAGTVHALGAGLLVAEIQQASNTTFRLFDWNRIGPDGLARELHVQQAMEVIDFSSGPRCIQIPRPSSQPGRQHLVDCSKFCLDQISAVEGSAVEGSAVEGSAVEGISIGDDDSFHFLTAPHGGVTLEGDSFCEILAVGDSVLLPAELRDCTARLSAGGVLLDMYLPQS